MRVRPTIRLRLTALYALLFTLGSAVLITVAYLFVQNQLSPAREPEAQGQELRQVFAEHGFVPPERADAASRPGTGRVLEDLPAELVAAIEQLRQDERDKVLADLLQNSIVAFAFAALASVAAAWIVAGRALKPVDAVTEKALTLSASSLHERLPTDGPDDELLRLRHAFNGMLGRLESGFESRRRFAADASHELRTPLAVLRASAENALNEQPKTTDSAELATSVLIQVERADRLAESLLALAKADELRLDLEQLDLATIVGDVVGDLALQADQAGLDLDLQLDDAQLTADQGLLTLLVANLVRNAIIHNEPGGTVAVAATTEEGRAVMRVSNSGPIVSEDEIEPLFERFRRGRLSTERHGHGLGLGLAIVEAVARSHNAEVNIASRPAGGLDVVVTFSPLDSA